MIEAGTLNKQSHEASKLEMYNKLDSMTLNMKNFVVDIEQRLEKTYKQGAEKKFGFERETASKMSARSDKSQITSKLK